MYTIKRVIDFGSDSEETYLDESFESLYACRSYLKDLADEFDMYSEVYRVDSSISNKNNFENDYVFVTLENGDTIKFTITFE